MKLLVVANAEHITVWVGPKIIVEMVCSRMEVPILQTWLRCLRVQPVGIIIASAPHNVMIRSGNAIPQIIAVKWIPTAPHISMDNNYETYVLRI